MSSRPLAPARALLLVLLLPSAIHAQTNGQLWANITLDWLKTDRLTYELDLEPKALVVIPAGQPAWANLDVTPAIEYALENWMDLTAEGVAGSTKQTDDDNSLELTARVGVRFHLLSRDLPTIVESRPFKSERPPKRRLTIRDWVRFEQRHFFYSDDDPNSSSLRFRNRLEFLFPLNRQKLTDDGARFLSADWEWFVPLDDPTERFASRQRIRLGVGYRRNQHWRFQGLYIWTRSRDTAQESFRTSDNIVDFQIKRVF